MALYLVQYGIISTLLIHSSLFHSLNGQVSHSNTSVQQVNYVTPKSSMPCLANQYPCFSIDEYASQVDKFFLNDSIFSFDPGNHSLNIGLNISGIHNVSFIGLPDNSVTIMVLNRSAFISWEDCENIEITNINFIIESNFSCVLSFNSTFCVKLSNIAILGNGHVGCSSIISMKSVVDISDSTFTGIRGYYGAALIASRSNVSFSGNNSFLRNKALSGGSMFLYGSAVLFNGTNSFYDNSASFVESYIELKIANDCFSSEYSMVPTQLTDSSGGAITSYSSAIIILDYSSETSAMSEFSFSTFSRWYPMNDSNYDNIECQMMQMYRIKSKIHQNRYYYCNGEYKLACPCSKDSIKNHVPSLRFYYNSARQFGGSILSFNSTIKAIGTIFFVENSAKHAGGGLYIRNTYFCFIGSPCLTYYAHLDNSLQLSSHMLFLENSATLMGGALYVNDANYTFYGNISFVNNSARYGGALYIRNSSISLNADRHSSINFTSIYVMLTHNLARYKGGAIYLSISANMQMYGNLSLKKNHALSGGGSIFLGYSTLQMCGSVSLVENNTPAKGGAIYLFKSTLQMCGTVTFEKNNANIGGAVHAEESNIIMGVNCSNIHALFTVVVFQLNTATYSGGSISSIDSCLYFMGSAQFDGNMAGYG